MPSLSSARALGEPSAFTLLIQLGQDGYEAIAYWQAIYLQNLREITKVGKYGLRDELNVRAVRVASLAWT
jgi:hypothetical protein